jgi:hypothetical protein
MLNAKANIVISLYFVLISIKLLFLIKLLIIFIA